MNISPTVPPVTPFQSVPSDKNYLTTGLLSIFLGVLGVHRFYLGKKGSGVAQFLTFGGLGLWTLVDVISILFGTVKDSNGRTVTKDSKSFKILCGAAGAVLVLGIVSGGGGGGGHSPSVGGGKFYGTDNGIEYLLEVSRTGTADRAGSVEISYQLQGADRLIIQKGPMNLVNSSPDELKFQCSVTSTDVREAKKEGGPWNFELTYIDSRKIYILTAHNTEVKLKKMP